MLCRALPSFAVLCHAACFAVLLLVRTYMPVTFEVSYHVPVLFISATYTRFVHITLLHHKQCTSSSGQPGYIQLSTAAQRGAVPCPSFCGAVSCGAVRSFERTAVAVPGMIQVPGLCTRCVLVFLLPSVDCPLSVPMPSPPPANGTRTAVHKETSTSTAQRRAISSAQAPLGIIINSIFAPNNHGPLLPAPFTYVSVAFFRARA